MIERGGADPKAFHPHKVTGVLLAMAMANEERKANKERGVNEERKAGAGTAEGGEGEEERGGEREEERPFQFLKLPQWLFDAQWAQDNM
jgi:hypothetical protein